MTDEKTAVAKRDDNNPVSKNHLRERERWAVMKARAKEFFESGLFPDCDNVHQAITKLETGRELGIPGTQAMRQIHTIPQSGGGVKMSLSADLMKALVKRKGDATFEYDESDGKCTLKATRHDTGETFTTTWTRDRAEEIRQGRKGVKRNWKAHEAEMLRHRCDAEACRTLWPDVIGGFYTPEEVHEVQEAEWVEQPKDAGEAIDEMMGEEPEDDEDAIEAEVVPDDSPVSDDEVPQESESMEDWE